MATDARIILFGTGDFALPTFLHLLETGHRIVALVTQPDRPQGRKQELIPSRITSAAVERGVAVLQPLDVNAEPAIEAIRALEPDLFVTAAYGQILSAKLLAVPRLGGLNLHGSVLPAYRGAAPVARAIQNGETESGVTVILMNPRVDAGGILEVARTPIDPDETAGGLEARLARLGAPLMGQCVEAMLAGTARVRLQDRARVSRAPKLTKADSPIDWSRPARAVHNQVRALQPWPAADTYLHKESSSPSAPLRVIVQTTAIENVERTSGQPSKPGAVVEAEKGRLVVAAGEGQVRLVTLQVVGKKPMDAADFLRGHPLAPGDWFGPP